MFLFTMYSMTFSRAVMWNIDTLSSGHLLRLRHWKLIPAIFTLLACSSIVSLHSDHAITLQMIGRQHYSWVCIWSGDNNNDSIVYYLFIYFLPLRLFSHDYPEQFPKTAPWHNHFETVVFDPVTAERNTSSRKPYPSYLSLSCSVSVKCIRRPDCSPVQMYSTV